MIHAVPSRMWYVEGFLIPSLTAQNVSRDDISVWLDKDAAGNLESCFRAFESLPEDSDGTWHLQDDVLVSRRFRESTEQYDSGIVCGHFWYRHKAMAKHVGAVSPENMWLSFPCIRIPNYYARLCARFYREVILGEEQYKPWVNAKRYDDTVFSLYLQTHGTTERIINLAPNLVAHIDYLIGGTVANGKTNETQQEPFFDEPETMEQLNQWLSERERK